MRARILGCFAVLILLWGAPAMAWQAPATPQAKLIAVYFSSKWCPNCQVLGPLIAKARAQGELDTKPIVFVTLDFSDKGSLFQSQMLASALGLGDYITQQGAAQAILRYWMQKAKQSVCVLIVRRLSSR